MLTQNGINAIAGMITKHYNQPIGTLPIVDLSGTTKYYTGGTGNSGSWPHNKSVVFNGSTYGVKLGTGDSPVKLSDYKLDAQVPSSSVEGSVVMTTGIDDGVVYSNYDVTVTNITDAPITIRELGLGGTIVTSTKQGATGTTSAYCLVERTVLSTPVTVAPGESELIRYRIEVPI